MTGSELTPGVLAELKEATAIPDRVLMWANHANGRGGGIMGHLGGDRVRCVASMDDARLGRAFVALWQHGSALIAAAEREAALTTGIDRAIRTMSCDPHGKILPETRLAVLQSYADQFDRLMDMEAHGYANPHEIATDAGYAARTALEAP